MYNRPILGHKYKSERPKKTHKYSTNIKCWDTNDHTALFPARLTLNSNPESCSTVEECEKVIKLAMMTANIE